MYCPKCGRDIDNSEFCPYCGTALSQNVIEIDNSNSDNMVEPEEDNIDEQIVIQEDDYIEINNNLFSCSGRITRVFYFLTIISIRIIYATIKYAYEESNNKILLHIFILSLLLMALVEFFATIKRLRDIEWSPYLSLLYFIPYAPTVIFIVLMFMEGKYNDYKNRPNKISENKM